MSVRLTVALIALLLAMAGKPAPAEEGEPHADVHARALARTTCQNGKQSAAVAQATTALERDPDELGPRMRLADVLVDQGCYQEAVGVLEAGQGAHPRSSELAGKLRDIRSLVTEQTYIEGLTQAAEAAKFQRNQLRCTRLADVTACEDALKIKPDDPQLLMAKEEAMQARLAAAQVVQATQAPQAGAAVGPAPPAGPAPQVAAAESTGRPKSPKRVRAAAPPVETPIPTVASLEPAQVRSYSNEAPPGRTN
jgi:hypothetical protein